MMEILIEKTPFFPPSIYVFTLKITLVSTKLHRETEFTFESSLRFGGLLESGVGLVDLVIPGLLGLGQLEPLEVVERGSRSPGDDAFVEGILLPLLVDFGRRPGLAHGSGPRAVGDRHLVLEQTHVLESHRLAGDAWSVNEGALLIDNIDDSDEPVFEWSDRDVGDPADFHEVVEYTHHLELSFYVVTETLFRIF